MEQKESLSNVNLSNQREFKEEYADYRERMRQNYYKVKYYLKGRLFWDSETLGTFKRQND